MVKCNVVPCSIDNESYIFISYAHNDADFLFPLIEDINKNGYNIWYDKGIQISSTWTDEIANAILNCKAFILFVTQSSMDSKYVRSEIEFALNKGLKIIPVYLESMDVLPPGLALGLNATQGINETEPDKIVDKICAALDYIGVKKYAGVKQIAVDSKINPKLKKYNSAKSTKSNKKLVPVISILLVLLIGTGTFAYFKVFNKDTEKSDNEDNIILAAATSELNETDVPNNESLTIETTIITEASETEAPIIISTDLSTEIQTEIPTDSPTEAPTEPPTEVSAEVSATEDIESTSEKTYLETLEPFAVSGLTLYPFEEQSDVNYVTTNNGKTYENGMYFRTNSSNKSVEYAIEGEYKTLQGVFAYSQLSKNVERKATLQIYGDDEMLAELTVGKGILPINFNIDVTNVQILKFTVGDTWSNIFIIGDTYLQK